MGRSFYKEVRKSPSETRTILVHLGEGNFSTTYSAATIGGRSTYPATCSLIYFAMYLVVGNVYDILQDSFTSLIVPMITNRWIEWGTLFLNKHKLDDRLAPFYLFTLVWMTGYNDDKPTFIGYPNLIFTESFTKIASYPMIFP